MSNPSCTLKRRNAIRIPPSRQDRTQTSLEQYRTLIDRGYEENRSLGVQPDVRERRNYKNLRHGPHARVHVDRNGSYLAEPIVERISIKVMDGHSPNVSDIHGTAHTPSKLVTIAPHQDIIHGALESPNRWRPSQVQESPSFITPVKMPTQDLRAARDRLVRSSAVTLLRQATLSRGNGITVDGTQRAALANASEAKLAAMGYKHASLQRPVFEKTKSHPIGEDIILTARERLARRVASVVPIPSAPSREQARAAYHAKFAVWQTETDKKLAIIEDRLSRSSSRAIDQKNMVAASKRTHIILRFAAGNNQLRR